MDSAARVTKKPTNQNQYSERRQLQQLLKCPRCESLNTKFCYYNNYSLSQPRHFCKSCKRYWTRGGTLRNVPMGGGCRNNKKIKKTTTTTFDHNPNSNHNPNPNPDHSTPSNDTLTNPNYSRFNTRVVSNMDASNCKYLIKEADVSKIGAKQLLIRGCSVASTDSACTSTRACTTNLAHTRLNSFSLGFSPLVSSCTRMFSDGLTSSCTGDHTMASVLASGLQEQPGVQGFAPYGDVGDGSLVNDVQIDGTKISMDDCNNDLNSHKDIDDHFISIESSNPTSYNLWTAIGGDQCEDHEWIDPTSSMDCQFLP